MPTLAACEQAANERMIKQSITQVFFLSMESSMGYVALNGLHPFLSGLGELYSGI
jgi:hypothetical protein